MRYTHRAALVLTWWSVACGDDSHPPDASMCEPELARPVARSGLAGVLDPSDQTLYVFGGDTGAGPACAQTPQAAADLWRYEVACKRWVAIPTELAPPARRGAAVALQETGSTRRMIVFGGRAGPAGAPLLLADVWAFDIPT